MIQFQDPSGSNNHNIRITDHLLNRMIQRGIRLSDISVVLTFGKIGRCKNGGSRYFFGKKESTLARAQGIDSSTVSRLSKGITVIAVHELDEVVVATAYWSKNRKAGKYERTERQVRQIDRRKSRWTI